MESLPIFLQESVSPGVSTGTRPALDKIEIKVIFSQEMSHGLFRI
jgi:hypothetical protein